MKKIFALLLILSMLIAYLPTELSAIAAETDVHQHYACSCVCTEDASCTHSEPAPVWTAWNGKSTINADGYYYLTADATLTAGVGIYADAYICLNGHTLTANPSSLTKQMLQVGNGTKAGHVTIMDCKSGIDAESGEMVYAGGITGAVSTNGGGGAIELGHLNLESTLKLIGIRISNCRENHTKENYGGGAIHVRNGVLSASLCDFDGNAAAGSSESCGGAISIYLGSADISNSSFTNNSASNKGGAIILREDCGGTLTLTDCTFTGNSSNYGAAVYIGKNGNFNCSGCRFSGNTAVKNGTIYLPGVTANIRDTELTGNKGGLFVGSDVATVTVSGKMKISGNTNAAGTADENLYFNKNKTLYVGDMTEGSDVRVQTKDTSETPAFVAKGDGFNAANWNEDSKYLTYTNKDVYISFVSDAFTFMEKDPHKHPVCDCSLTGGECTHDRHNWVKWEYTTSLPTAAGYYYLDADVEISTKQIITADVHICLNGHNIRAKEGFDNALIQISNASIAGSLTLADCTAAVNDDGYLESAGAVTGVRGTKGSGAVIVGFSNTAGTLNAIGIKFTDNTESYAAENYGGGAIQVRGGRADFCCCSFEGNKANAEDEAGPIGAGGAISVYKGAAAAEKTCFTGNTSAGKGGAVYLRGGVGTAFTATGCTFTGNSSGNYGGAIYAANGSMLALNNCTLTDNSAAKNGTVFSEAARIGITDTVINNNKGGLYVTSTFATVTLSGDTVINDSREGVFLKGDKMLTVGELTSGTNILIATTNEETTDPDSFLQTAEGLILADTGITGIIYKCASGTRSIGYRTGDKFYFSDAHAHCECGDGTDSNCSHEILNWVPWYNTATLPSVSGNYYLTADVELNHQVTVSKADVNIKLCLNGKNIHTSKEGYIYKLQGSGDTLVITDCCAYSSDGIYHAGTLSGATASALVAYNTRIDMYEGKISGCSSTGGGAVMVLKDKGEFNLFCGELSGNSANSAGAIYIDRNSTVNIYGGNINSNKSNLKYGGAIRCLGTLNMYGGNLRDNEAPDSGGGIYIEGADAKADIRDTEFGGNSANLGGGIFAAKGASLNMKGGSMIGNSATKYAGALGLANASKAVVSGTEIKSNKAESAGAILINSGSILTLNGGAVIKSNKAVKGYGGGIVAAGSADKKVTLIINDASVSDNKADKTGGGIQVNGGTLEFNGGKISSNSCGSQGGGIYAKDAKLHLSGGRVSDNTCGQNGAGICAGAISVINLNGSVISGNRAEAEGACAGGILISGEGSVMNFYSGSVQNNYTKKSGGGIYSSKGTSFNMSGGSIRNNECGESGGGLVLGLCKSDITGGRVTGNKAGVNAGGVYNSGKCIVNIKNLVISNNTAEGAGAGIVAASRGTVLNIRGGEISGNKSVKSGAGLYQSRYTTVNISGTKVFDNETAKNGAGLYFAGDAAFVKDIEVYGNKSGEHGAGIMLEKQSRMEADGIKAHDNEAGKHGGGIYLSTGTAAVLKNAVLTTNKAAERGAALWCGGTLVMSDITATGNDSGKLGNFYIADNRFDGQSYAAGYYRVSGKIYIYDNPGEGKNMYLSGVSCMSIAPEGLAEGSKIGISLKEGVLTDKLLGAYDYEGGDLEYVVTPGTRSLTDFETAPTEPEQEIEAESSAEEALPESFSETKEEDPEDFGTLVPVLIGSATVLAGGGAAIIASIAGKKKKEEEK